MGFEWKVKVVVFVALIASVLASILLLGQYILYEQEHTYHRPLRLPLQLTLHELQQAETSLRAVVQDQFYLFVSLFSLFYLFKQTFAIPGSVMLNLAAGWLFPITLALPLVCLLTSVGASNCYLLSYYFGSELTIKSICDYFLPNQLDKLRDKVDQAKEDGELKYFLVFIRVFPLTPNWFLNLILPWLNIPLSWFAVSVIVGLLPYNLITVQAGSLLSELQSTNDIWNFRSISSLLLISLGVMLPVLLKKREKHAKST